MPPIKDHEHIAVNTARARAIEEDSPLDEVDVALAAAEIDARAFFRPADREAVAQARARELSIILCHTEAKYGIIKKYVESKFPAALKSSMERTQLLYTTVCSKLFELQIHQYNAQAFALNARNAFLGDLIAPLKSRPGLGPGLPVIPGDPDAHEYPVPEALDVGKCFPNFPKTFTELHCSTSPVQLNEFSCYAHCDFGIVREDSLQVRLHKFAIFLTGKVRA